MLAQRAKLQIESAVQLRIQTAILGLVTAEPAAFIEVKGAALKTRGPKRAPDAGMFVFAAKGLFEKRHTAQHNAHRRQGGSKRTKAAHGPGEQPTEIGKARAKPAAGEHPAQTRGNAAQGTPTTKEPTQTFAQEPGQKTTATASAATKQATAQQAARRLRG